ncbi:MAG: tetratricopeptide repeat protein [Desulforhopalus sp.]
MDAVTYPNEKVTDFIKENFIALRIASSEEPYAANYMVKWTPRIIVLDSVGLVHQSSVGFLPPEDFIPSLLMGLAKSAFDLDNVEECKKHLEHVLEEYPESISAPEAVYLRGVSAYKIDGQAEPLKNAYHTLRDSYPGSEWVKRAMPYRLL